MKNLDLLDGSEVFEIFDDDGDESLGEADSASQPEPFIDYPDDEVEVYIINHNIESTFQGIFGSS